MIALDLGTLPPIFSLPPAPTTTCHPYTTHQRVLGSGNGGLERVGKSRGLEKERGLGRVQVSQTSSHFAYQLKNHPYPLSSMLTWPYPDSLYPKQRPPIFYPPKLSLATQFVAFWHQQLPLTPCPITGPHDLKNGVPQPGMVSSA